jgi:A/G-specific adenine glycosylase
VTPVYEIFIRSFPTVHSLANTSERKISVLIKSLGLSYRVKRLKAIATLVVEKYGGSFPEDLHELLKLPGVGLYIAGMLLCFAFEKPVPVLDSNIKRVLERVFDAKFPKNAHKKPSILQYLDVFFPRHERKEFTIGLLDIGITICHPKNPQCKKCPLLDICKYGLSVARPL